MPRPALRALVAGAFAASVIAAPVALAAPAGAAPAPAEPRALVFPVPDLGKIITDLGATLGTIVGGTLPGAGAITTETSTNVGGLVTGSTTALAEAIEAALGNIITGPLGQIVGPSAGGGGDAGGLLPLDALEQLLATLGIPTLGGKDGDGPGAKVVTDDGVAPSVRFEVLTTKLRNTGRDGRLKLRVTSDEPGIVALATTIRPGRAVATRRGTARSSAAHSRRVIHVPSVTLGFKRAGALAITVRMSTAARRTLARSRDMRISVRLLAADAAKNQAASTLKRTLKR